MGREHPTPPSLSCMQGGDRIVWAAAERLQKVALRCIIRISARTGKQNKNKNSDSDARRALCTGGGGRVGNGVLVQTIVCPLAALLLRSALRGCGLVTRALFRSVWTAVTSRMATPVLKPQGPRAIFQCQNVSLSAYTLHPPSVNAKRLFGPW